MHSWLNINSNADVEKLSAEIPESYNPTEVARLLKRSLSPEVKGILIESEYVDKDYRSTYYGFYSKKGLRYSSFCIRLHFFRAGVSLTPDLELRSSSGRLEEHYIGYMVVRPTPIAPIGRTVLSVHARANADGAIIDANHHVHVLGYRFEVRGFPFMQQHTDISICAHAACWSILRHYSQRYRRYAEFAVGDITLMASATNPGGLIPSRGLRVEQACRVFSQATLFPDIYTRDEFDENFYRLLNAYVESGFPVFGALHEKQHAITIIGHGKVDREALDNVAAPLYAWDAINSLVVIDDNYMPYLTIDALNPNPYTISDIDTFIVPLPEKIYFPAEAVEGQVEGLLAKGFPRLDWTHLKKPVIRYFITTSANLRKYIREQSSALPSELFRTLIEIALPQFVWVVQITDLEDWKKQRANTIWVLDATASALDEQPFFLLHDRKTAFVYDRGESTVQGWFAFDDKQFEFISEFRGNLTYRQ